jgi:site-specific DNA recombinase
MNPYYAPIVRKIFDDYTAGKSMSAIADDLNNNGITTPQGTAFQPCSVAYVLDNVIYTGQVRGKDGVYPGEHVALVDQDKFDQAAVRRNDAQNRKHGYNYRKHTSFLSGLMVCAECGQKLDINHGAIDANGNYSKYVAMRNKKDKGCSFEPVRLDVIERQTRTISGSWCHRTTPKTTMMK